MRTRSTGSLVTLGVVLLLVLFTSLAAGARPHGRGGGPGTCDMHARLHGPGHGGGGAMRGAMGGLDRLGQGILRAADEIGLTDAQRDALKKVRRSAPGKIMPKAQAVMEARMDLHDLMAKEDADAAALRRAHDKLLQAQQALKAARFDLRLEVRNVLTAEQRKKLHELRKERVKERGQRRIERLRRGEAPFPPGPDGAGWDVDLDDEVGESLE